MRKIIEAYKKEEQLPYLVLIFLIVQACMIMLSLVGIGYGGVGVILIALTNDFSITFGYLVSLVTNALILGLIVWATMIAIKHDRALRKSKKDERELLHDQMVAMKGYKISIIGIVIFLILTADPLIIFLLLAILTARFVQRIKLEGSK